MSNRAHECSWRATVASCCWSPPQRVGAVWPGPERTSDCGWPTGMWLHPQESMHKLRTCGALQSGVALPIHMGDSVARLIQDTDTLNKLQCSTTASRTQSLVCAWPYKCVIEDEGCRGRVGFVFLLHRRSKFYFILFYFFCQSPPAPVIISTCLHPPFKG